MTKDIENPETIEINGLITIHKLCKFGADNNMEGCTFTEIVERMFLELKKLEGCVVVPIKCPDPDFADLLFDELGKKAIGTFGEDMLIHFSDINEEKIWDLMLEAARGGNE